jgi:hypothetical protein
MTYLSVSSVSKVLYLRRIAKGEILWEEFHFSSYRFGVTPTRNIMVKLSLCFNSVPRHEGVLGTGGIAPRIFLRRWVVKSTPRPLHSKRKSPWYPLDRRLGGSQSRSGCGGEEKNSQLLPVLDPPIIQSVAQRYTTELSRLPCKNLNYKWFRKHLVQKFCICHKINLIKT